MSNAKRAGVLVAAAAVLILMFVAFRPEDDGADRAPVAGSTPSTRPDAVPTQTAQPERREPPPPLLRSGETRRLVFEKGGVVRFRVRSADAEELHVHGYDIRRALPAGRTVDVRFPARLEGIFEIELHGSHTIVGRLEVRP